jgi:hypothetical protein
MKLLSLLAAAMLLLITGLAAPPAAQAQPNRCGGVAGFRCPAGEVCRMTGPRHPDQMGVCVPRRGCTREYRPVCGRDRHTYANACLARNAGVAIAHQGQCRTRACPRIYRPVCGVDRRTYPNACTAANAGVRIRHQGRC